MSETPGPVIETYTGGRFRPFDPRPADVQLLDIAAGLAHTCRFGGHCREFYSVAQHSLHVSREFDAPRLQLLALLHDAGEAYLGDIPRPVKAELERMADVEATIRGAVWTALGVDPPERDEWERVMTADDRLLAYEADRLLADGSWATESPELGYELGADAIETVRDRFHSRGEQLLAKVDAGD
jgi:5'-deoxynucleotidase YfbR-like HD superfamily hydrolase